MEDADSDSGFDSDGNRYHAGRDIVHGLRTDSYAVGPDGAHRRRFLCGEEKKGGTRWGCLSFLCRQVQKMACTCFFMQRQLQILVQTLLSIVNVCG